MHVFRHQSLIELELSSEGRRDISSLSVQMICLHGRARESGRPTGPGRNGPQK